MTLGMNKIYMPVFALPAVCTLLSLETTILNQSIFMEILKKSSIVV